MLHKAGTVTLDGAGYTYDNAGNRTSKTNYLNNVTENYTYDPIYQLTQVTQGLTTTESYSYDAVGNRLSSVDMSPYIYNSSNQLTSTPAATFTYDPNGNIATKADMNGTTTYSRDFENRLISVVLPGTGSTVTFKYDPFGRRIQKSSASGTTNYLYDGSNSVEELDQTGALLAHYAQGAGIDEPLAALRAGTAGFYEQDGLASVTSMTDPTGAVLNSYTYDSFGRAPASSGSFVNPYQYTGRDFDAETGLQYYRARYYSAEAGRFLTEDPIRFGGGTNFYRYVHNAPATQSDPSGLWDTQTHSNLYWDALRGCGVSLLDIWLIQQESADLDSATQWPWDSYVHSMRAPWQSPAVRQRDAYIDYNLGLAAYSLQRSPGGWTLPFADALHTLTDSTSPAHVQNGVPLAWPWYPNMLQHGDEQGSIETWQNMTPELYKKNIDLIRGAYERVTGHKCGCDEQHDTMYWKYLGQE